MSDPTLCTVLNDRHRSLGGTMAPFGGWDMPLWYKAGAIREHLAVIQAAGIFDTSHMDVVLIEGDAARAFLNYAYTRDIADLKLGRCAYGAFLDTRGHCLDDAIVYPLEENRFAVVVNASMAPRIIAHLSALPGADGLSIRSPEPRLAKLDIQGPHAVKIVSGMIKHADEILASFPYFSFKGDFDPARTSIRLTDGTPILLSRTGYTGEVGFEIFMPLDKAVEWWDRLLNAHAGDGLLPCGLAARDSLRTGAMMALSHQDIGDWPFADHPWPFALPLSEDGKSFTKKFHGSDALRLGSGPFTLPFVGFDPRRVESGEAKVLLDGREIGTVSTIVSDMAIGRVDGKVVSLATPGKPEGWNARGLACGFVRVSEKLAPGTALTLKDSRREIKVEIAENIRPDRTARKKLDTFR